MIFKSKTLAHRLCISIPADCLTYQEGFSPIVALQFLSLRKKRSENYYNNGVILTDSLIDGTDTELELLSKFQFHLMI